MFPPAGDLTERVSLERDVITRIKGVETKGAPVIYARTWASVAAISGREFWAAQQVNSQINWQITMRFRKDVASEHRVIYGVRRFEIVTIVPDFKWRGNIVLMCRELN